MASKNFHSKEYWEAKIRQWLSSGKSAKSWCTENQVVYNTFLGWQNRLKFRNNQKANCPLSQNQLNPPKAHFIELKNQVNTHPGIYLEYANVQIHLSNDFDATTLRKCLDVLQGDLC